jgi:hypothetical protein
MLKRSTHLGLDPSLMWEKSDLKGVHKLIDGVTLTMNGRSYTRSSIEAVQLLHYKAMDQDDLFSHMLTHPADSQLTPSAELVIFYGKETAASPPTHSDVDRMTVDRKQLHRPWREEDAPANVEAWKSCATLI